MHLAAVRWVADLLKDPDTGLNVVIADGVPTGDDTLEVPLVSIYDETRDAWIAWGSFPAQIKKAGPCLIVRAIGAAEVDAIPNNSIGTARVALHVVAPVDVDGPKASVVRLQAAFLLRAAQRVVARAIPDEVAADRPVVWGAAITPPGDEAFAYQPMYDPEVLQGGALIDALLIAVSVDDPWAKGFAPDAPATP